MSTKIIERNKVIDHCLAPVQILGQHQRQRNLGLIGPRAVKKKLKSRDSEISLRYLLTISLQQLQCLKGKKIRKMNKRLRHLTSLYIG